MVNRQREVASNSPSSVFVMSSFCQVFLFEYAAWPWQVVKIKDFILGIEHFCCVNKFLGFVLLFALDCHFTVILVHTLYEQVN